MAKDENVHPIFSELYAAAPDPWIQIITVALMIALILELWLHNWFAHIVLIVSAVAFAGILLYVYLAHYFLTIIGNFRGLPEIEMEYYTEFIRRIREDQTIGGIDRECMTFDNINKLYTKNIPLLYCENEIANPYNSGALKKIQKTILYINDLGADIVAGILLGVLGQIPLIVDGLESIINSFIDIITFIVFLRLYNEKWAAIAFTLELGDIVDIFTSTFSPIDFGMIVEAVPWWYVASIVASKQNMLGEESLIKSPLDTFMEEYIKFLKSNNYESSLLKYENTDVMKEKLKREIKTLTKIATSGNMNTVNKAMLTNRFVYDPFKHL